MRIHKGLGKASGNPLKTHPPQFHPIFVTYKPIQPSHTNPPNSVPLTGPTCPIDGSSPLSHRQGPGPANGRCINGARLSHRRDPGPEYAPPIDVTCSIPQMRPHPTQKPTIGCVIRTSDLLLYPTNRTSPCVTSPTTEGRCPLIREFPSGSILAVSRRFQLSRSHLPAEFQYQDLFLPSI